MTIEFQIIVEFIGIILMLIIGILSYLTARQAAKAADESSNSAKESVIAAKISNKISKQAILEGQKGRLASIIRLSHELYSSDEMTTALNYWTRIYETEEYQKWLTMKFLKERKAFHVPESELYRRQIVHYFHLLGMIRKNGIISNEDMEKFVNEYRVEILLKIFEEVEYKINNNYDTDTFDIFRTIYPELSEKYPSPTTVIELLENKVELDPK